MNQNPTPCGKYPVFADGPTQFLGSLGVICWPLRVDRIRCHGNRNIFF